MTSNNNCSHCASCGWEPDDDACCYNSEVLAKVGGDPAYGVYLHGRYQPRAVCEGKYFVLHPSRVGNGPAQNV